MEDIKTVEDTTKVIISTDTAFDMVPAVCSIYDKIDVKTFTSAFADEMNTAESEVDETIVGLDLFMHVLRQSSLIKDEIVEIVSILEDRSIEDVRAQSIIKSLTSIKTIFEDREIMGFFESVMG